MHQIKQRISTIVAGVIALQVCSTTVPALAEAWPDRTVRVMVAVGPGSAVDTMARLYAKRLAERWKQPVYVENRPGADGLIGTTAFAAVRDDYSLFFSPAAPISVYPYIYAQLGYDPAHDIVPIVRAADTFISVVASTSLNTISLDGLVALARARPGKFNYYAAAGAFPTLFAAFLKRAALDMVSISYRETNLAVQDIASGRVDLGIATLGTFIPTVESGKAHAIAITNTTRAPLVADVPTVTEAGYPDLAFEGLLGFFGPRSLAPDIRDRVASDVSAIAADTAFAKRLIPLAAVARGGTPAEFASAIEVQRARMAASVKILHAK